MDFFKKIEEKWHEKKFVSIGLDPDIEKIPNYIKGSTCGRIFEFHKQIIDATSDLVCCYKPNSAFFEAYGTEGMESLKQTIDYSRQKYKDIPILLDAKRADINSTNEGYIKSFFEYLAVDAITLHPYLGRHALQPFLKLKDKMFFILVKTSNHGSDEFQNLKVGKNMLYKIVAEHVSKKWNTNKNCGVVVGATYPRELASVRKIIGDMPILIPGIGSQGGDIEKTVKMGKNSKNSGMIINSSRGIIYASSGKDFAEAARRETEKLTLAVKKSL